MIISIVKNKSGKFNLEKPTVYSTSAGDKMMTVEISLIFSSWPIFFIHGPCDSLIKAIVIWEVDRNLCLKESYFSHHTTSVQGLKNTVTSHLSPFCLWTVVYHYGNNVVKTTLQCHLRFSCDKMVQISMKNRLLTINWKHFLLKLEFSTLEMKNNWKKSQPLFALFLFQNSVL